MSKEDLGSNHEESRRGFLQLMAGGIGALASGMALPAAAQQASSGDDTLYESASGDITMALGGDAMITRALMPFREERFLKLRDLFQRADVGFANSEMLFHNYENWPTASTYYSKTYMRCAPRFIKDLQWLGINLLSCANNHSGDFGQEGVLTNIRNLDDAGMVHAGSGANYAEALAPAYLDTRKGRVALLAATTSATPDARAGDQRRDMKGRPGVNFVRSFNEWTVDSESYEALLRVAKQFGWDKPRPAANRIFFRDYGIAETDEAVYFSDRTTFTADQQDCGARFVAGKAFERHSRINGADLQRNLQSVKEARRMSEWVIYSVHSLEDGRTMDEPSDHLQTLAHSVIDAGADVVVGHTPHRTKGIEIYQGKPIFYSLSCLIEENGTVLLEPEDALVAQGLGQENDAADSYDERISSGEIETSGVRWYGVVPIVSYRGKKLHDITLYPIELGAGLPPYQSGRPVLAQGKVAAEVLQRMQHLSEPFHTKLDVQGDRAIVQLAT